MSIAIVDAAHKQAVEYKGAHNGTDALRKHMKDSVSLEDENHMIGGIEDMQGALKTGIVDYLSDKLDPQNEKSADAVVYGKDINVAATFSRDKPYKFRETVPGTDDKDLHFNIGKFEEISSDITNSDLDRIMALLDDPQTATIKVGSFTVSATRVK